MDRKAGTMQNPTVFQTNGPNFEINDHLQLNRPTYWPKHPFCKELIKNHGAGESPEFSVNIVLLSKPPEIILRHGLPVETAM